MIRIFIESGVSAARSKGKKTTNEQDFVEKIIAHYFPEAVVSKDFEVVGVDGWTNIANQSYDFKQNTDESGTNLVVFDADEDRNGGGFEKRKASLEDFKKKAGIEFDLFLWPDNKGDGDFELLLSKVINAKHQCLLDCYDEFEKNVRQHDPKEEKYVTPGRKGKMYTYETLHKGLQKLGNEIKAGYWQFDNPEYWNLEGEKLKPLVEFLTPYFDSYR